MKSEVIIIGGGIIGLTLASILAKSGINTILFENNMTNKINNRLDGRASAINARSKIFLEKYELWQVFEHYAAPIDHINIIDNTATKVVFDKALVGNQTLGYMVENYYITKILYENAQDIENLTIIESDFDDIDHTQHKIILESNNVNYQANLLIGADGKFSKVRKMANISSKIHKFNQTAIVCNVKHELDHNNTAYEKFSSQGPFAILPLKDGKSSSIVWVEKEQLAKLYLSMNHDEFLYYLKRKFGSHLGDVDLISDIFSYNLSSLMIDKYYDNRIVLVGDAAHSIHPLAGQGLNLGLFDIEILSELIIDETKYGLDIGSEIIFNQYQKSRIKDNENMLYITSILNSLFSNDLFSINIFRKLGLNIVESLPIAKKFFMKYAMGFRL